MYGSPNGPKWGSETTKFAKNAKNGRETTNFANDANGALKQAERTLGVPGKGRKAHLRGFASICGRFSAFGGLWRAQNADLDRKWTQMDANGDGEQPEMVIFGRKTGGEGGGNYENREKREKRAENRSKMVKNGRFGVF